MAAVPTHLWVSASLKSPVSWSRLLVSNFRDQAGLRLLSARIAGVHNTPASVFWCGQLGNVGSSVWWREGTSSDDTCLLVEVDPACKVIITWNKTVWVRYNIANVT